MCFECLTVREFFAGVVGVAAAPLKVAEEEREPSATLRPLLNLENQLALFFLGRTACLLVLVALMQTQLSRCLLCLWAFDTMAVCCSAAMAASHSPKATRGFVLELLEILENKDLVSIFFLLSFLAASPFLVPPFYLTAPAAIFIAFSVDEDMASLQVQRCRSLYHSSSVLRQKGSREAKIW
ncbi:hypothetical protein T484DRAFT_3615841 [Baffinella frigidus]|nr:hypothetical protein T484DRAFT_3615841 [Cryptophyta sp. CCMP2293]